MLAIIAALLFLIAFIIELIYYNGADTLLITAGFLLVEYDIPRGCLGAYYPETNPLVPLSSVADGAGTPTSKSIPVLLKASAVVDAIAA